MTRPPLLSFLEGSSSCWDTNLRYASHVREDFPPRTFLHVLLTYGALCWAFTIYWQSPRTFYCPWMGPRPNILFLALTLTIAPQNSRFSLPSKERKWGFDLFRRKIQASFLFTCVRTWFYTPHKCYWRFAAYEALLITPGSFMSLVSNGELTI